MNLCRWPGVRPGALSVLVAAAALAGCGTLGSQPSPARSTVAAKIAEGDARTTASMYACLHELVLQGVPLAVATRECYQRLAGFVRVGTAPFGAGLDAFGVQVTGRATGANIRAGCAGGVNPMLAGDKVKDGETWTVVVPTEDGGSIEITFGPVKEVERVKADGTVIRADTKVNDKPGAGGKPDGGTKRETGSACSQVVDEARALLTECNRTGWVATACQQIQAEARGCPDPTLIRVDPEQGYVCGASADPEAARKAYEDHCRRTTQPVPGGPDPCAPANPGAAGMVYKGPPRDTCSDPRALVALTGRVEGDECFAVIEPRNPAGGPSIGEFVVWAQGLFGGPTFVLPLPRGGGGGGGGGPPQCRLVPC